MTLNDLIKKATILANKGCGTMTLYDEQFIQITDFDMQVICDEEDDIFIQVTCK